MTDLTPITALGGTIARVETYGALSLAENPAMALASLALRKGQSVPSPFAMTLPEPGKWTQSGAIGLYWTAKGQWMVEAEGRADEDFARVLKAEVPEASVTEQTDGWAVIEITSSKGAAPIKALLEKLVNLDVEAFTQGSALRTGLEHMSVFLIRRAEDRLAFWGMRSSTETLWHTLAVAARRLEDI